METTTILQTLLSLLTDIAMWATAISIVFVVILENKNPIKTLLWVFVLLYFPILGLIGYFLFGQKFQKKWMISRKSYKRVNKRLLENEDANNINNLAPSLRLLARMLNNVNNSVLLSGNKISIFTNGKEKIESLFSDLQSAKHHIHLLYYIIDEDEIGNQLSEILIDRARSGVKIRIIYDDVACWKTNPLFFERLREEGIETRAFLKVRFPLFTGKINYRNHRKIAVIDGKIGYIGGMNIANRYVIGPKTGGKWRDTHLRITGKGCYGLQAAFIMDWFFVDRSQLSSRELFPEQPELGNESVQIITSGPTDRWHTMHQAVHFAITHAQRYIYIQTPYFLPTDTLLDALESSALSGVDVRIMIPKEPDVFLTAQASRSYLKQLMEAGIKVYLYNKGFLHAKTIVWDDLCCTCGSTNIDFRSFEHNFEANAFIYSKEIAEQMKMIFHHDQEDSIRLKLKEWEQRPLKNKITESILRLFSPLM